MKKIFIEKKTVVFKLSTFYFEISTLSYPGFCFSFLLHLLQLELVVSKAWVSFTLQVCVCNV